MHKKSFLNNTACYVSHECYVSTILKRAKNIISHITYLEDLQTECKDRASGALSNLVMYHYV